MHGYVKVFFSVLYCILSTERCQVMSNPVEIQSDGARATYFSSCLAERFKSEKTMALPARLACPPARPGESGPPFLALWAGPGLRALISSISTRYSQKTSPREPDSFYSLSPAITPFLCYYQTYYT